MLTGIGIGIGLLIIGVLLFKFVLNGDTQDAVLRKFNVMVKKAIKTNSWDMLEEAYDQYIIAVSQDLPQLKNAASVSTEEATQARKALEAAKEKLRIVDRRLENMEKSDYEETNPLYLATGEEGMNLEREIAGLEESVPELELIAKHLTEDYHALDKKLKELRTEKVNMVRDMKAQKTQMEMRGLLERSAANGGASAQKAIEDARAQFEANKKALRGETAMRENSPEVAEKKARAEMDTLDTQAWIAARRAAKKGESANG